MGPNAACQSSFGLKLYDSSLERGMPCAQPASDSLSGLGQQLFKLQEDRAVCLVAKGSGRMHSQAWSLGSTCVVEGVNGCAARCSRQESVLFAFRLRQS